MMPTFPRPSLSFRTAGSPRYGWKAGIWSSTFPCTNRLKPAPGIHRLMFGLCLHFARVEATSVIPHCVGRGARACAAMEVGYSSAPGVLAPVRFMLSRTVITYSTPSAPPASTSRFHRIAAYTQCLAARERRRHPRVVPGFRSPLLLGMPLSMTPGSSIIASPELRCRHGLRRDLSSSALPFLPQSVSRGARISGLPDSRICYGLPSCSPPCTDQTDTLGHRELLLPGFQRIGCPPRCWV
jgi:hypothetical protein